MNRERIAKIGIPVAIVMVVVMMVVPLPPMLLDLFITMNISAALAIVVSTMYLNKALEFSSFPSLLLLTTLFRLAINVSVTRLILLHGDAGSVVKAFGDFVVGGNVVVGLVIFLVLVVIQFAVITNGAGRVAEVGARFTLDAMPGKQMAIDADLNAGLINEDQARKRRYEVTAEADFYGSMDGASKFVKGDAIAGIIVTLVNLVSETRAVPEYLGRNCQPGPMALALFELLENPGARAEQVAAMDLTMDRLGRGGEPPGLRAARSVIAAVRAPR